jgi:hypothetical protein
MAVCAPYAPIKARPTFSAFADTNVQILGGLMLDCMPDAGFLSRRTVMALMTDRIDTMFELAHLQKLHDDGDLRARLRDVWFEFVQHYFESDVIDASKVVAFARRLQDGSIDEQALQENLKGCMPSAKKLRLH